MAPNRGYIDKVFEFAELCETLASVEGVVNAINPVVADLAFSLFIMTGLPLPDRPLEPLVLLHSWPHGWFERYCSQNYFEVDPVGQNVLATSAPFLWGDAPYRKDRGLAGQMMGEAAEFGLTDGFCVPIYSATGWRSAFSFAHEHKVNAGPKELAAAHLLALTTHGRLRVILSEEPPGKAKADAARAGGSNLGSSRQERLGNIRFAWHLRSHRDHALGPHPAQAQCRQHHARRGVGPADRRTATLMTLLGSWDSGIPSVVQQSRSAHAVRSGLPCIPCGPISGPSDIVRHLPRHVERTS